MTVIALTGGIASGKSTIGRRLAELGASRIDADQLARDAVAPGTPGLARVAERFGADRILTAAGELDRAALGAIVFQDAAALQDLNGIVHPEVAQLYAAAVAGARAANPDGLIVYEIPLLAETGRAGEFDLVVVADAPEEVRIARMVELRGMTEEDARRRIAQQATAEERLAIADVVIDTSGTEADTLAQVDALWARLAEERRA
ncbi:dephospho-CoA kinase [Leucobacter chromiireducens]|uniref:Dephospho-CoA kinase n=1 Tax=Leucobacter chromiireducens subsp. solipictus TaxID=398235 RepID=A0ABS1SB63_9MICO|nr:dephospho-CoA kinase [Leucobacter chromiireducens]MBL3677784.1 dephospho-CoA kinase [Leucobacter chromiireducens subsp. solipictus]